MISAKIIADSKGYDQRITSFVLTFPRIVLAEFNTHRMLSRNSASSRAIPFKTMLNLVKTDPFIPIKWQKEHKGMQGTEYFEDDYDRHQLTKNWLYARDRAVGTAISLSDCGLTKQICNRLLEPFMYHKVIATGTEWENFFALRAHPAAEIHIALLADLMLQAMNESKPKQLDVGQWHIPFGDNLREDDILPILYNINADPGTIESYKVKIATARCARVSYNNFEGNDDYNADIKLHDRLSGLGHWSPFEHCARAMSDKERVNSSISELVNYEGREAYLVQEGWSGNFRGFVQYRKTFDWENKNEPRLITK